MKKKKRPVTLIEIMIVILLIGIIGGVLAFNMKGSLDKGRDFKTEQTKKRIEDILNLELATGTKTPEEILDSWQEIVLASPLSGGTDKSLKSGHNKEFKVEYKEDSFIAKSP
jgi:general secretion pathway protein G